MAVSGCGSDDSTGPTLPPLGSTVPPPSGPPTAHVPDSPTLRSDLLATFQLPPGFTPLDDPEPGITGAGERTDPPQCAKVLAPIADQASGAAARAAAQFSGPDFSSIDIDAAAYLNGAAAQAFSTAQSLLRECTSYSGTDADNTVVDFRVGGLEQPTAGDASTAFRVHTSSEGFTLYSAVSVTLVGATVVQVALTSQREPDPQQFSALTAAQVQKLRHITGP
ncbi:hypothetical protein HLB23_20075 [Nocardia uniformis]|uniref:Sensor domain-containing protein n=2 Tax=Nocardia uniformis TaxID=53432 RepID=A0A849C311_9NOCA|nr:hypothetical protein [Nocardia uniformis]